MRVTSVELRPEGSSDIIELSFRDPRNQNPFQVKSIAPLDADELTPQFYGTSGDSTKKYYNIALKKREPVMLIGLNPRFGGVTENSFTELRDRLYRIISSSRTGIVQIIFRADGAIVATISGTISKMEASLFTEKPEVQITFSCPDGMLKSIARWQVVEEPMAMDAFTVTNESSTAPSGFRFEAKINDPVDRFVINPPSVEDKFDVRPHGGFLANDVLYFSSEPRNKYIYLMRGGIKTQLADVVQAGSIWPILFPGNNEFVTNVVVTWQSMDYYRTYWGV